MITLMRVNENMNSRSSRINEEAQWKTMRGAHILVDDDGKIIAGPDPSKSGKSSSKSSAADKKKAAERAKKVEEGSKGLKQIGLSKADAEAIAGVFADNDGSKKTLLDAGIPGEDPIEFSHPNQIANMIAASAKGGGGRFRSGSVKKTKDGGISFDIVDDKYSPMMSDDYNANHKMTVKLSNK